MPIICTTARPSRRAFLVSASSAALAVAQPNLVTAETASGKIRGVDRGGIKCFLGVPYGASTAGANRFVPPKRPAPWAGIRDCVEWGPSAPQSTTLAARIAQGIAPAESLSYNTKLGILNSQVANARRAERENPN